MEEKIKTLVEFGNYLLSKERDNITSEECKSFVTDADIKNFFELKKEV